MVLIVYKKYLILVFLFFLNVIFVFGESSYSDNTPYTISGLIQYGENIDRDKLELLEDRQVIRTIGDDSWSKDYSVNSSYMIRNSGSEYLVTLGLLFEAMQSDAPFISRTGIKFFVNGEEINYREIQTQKGIVLGGNVKTLEQYSTAWALIDVFFPENSTLTIQVEYINKFDWLGNGSTYFLVYNPGSLSYFPELLYWRGSVKFSVEFTNEFVYKNSIEYYWVSNIQFINNENCQDNIHHIFYDMNNNIRTKDLLFDMKELESDLFRITKIDKSSFRIDFTKEFLDNYSRSIIVEFRIWTTELGAYIYCNTLTKAVSLTVLRGNAIITDRKLASYELLFLTNNQLRIMRNVFYARHGYIFASEEILDMFRNNFYYDDNNRFYEPNPNFTESMLTDIDRANIETIQRLEALAGN